MVIEITDGVNGVVQECWLYPGSHANRNMGLYSAAYTVTGSEIFTVLKAVIPDLGNIEVVSSRFELQIYSFAPSPPANIYWNRIKKVWNEGTGVSSSHSTLDGEVTYNSARHNEELWEVPGAQGSSDITAQIGSLSVTGASRTNIDIPVEDAQGWYDGSFINQGILMRSLDSNIYWYTSENSTSSFRPSFYMEYVDAPSGWKSNSHYGNRMIASINAPYRSRRIY